MKRFNTFCKSLAGLMLAFVATAGMASEGHDHGEAAATTAATSSPRFEAYSDLFEMVGIVSKGQMLVYLDRYASNEPVTGAKLDFEVGADKGTAVPQPDGTYLIKLATLGQPGNTAFSFTVTAGSDTDLLAGDLSISDGHAHVDAGRPWLRWLAWLGFGLVAIALAAGAAFLVRRQRAQRLSFN